MIVMKFGGTSVATADRIRRVATLVAGPGRPVVVVTSALGGVTDDLLRLGELARTRDAAGGAALFETLRRRHNDAADGVTTAGAGRTALVASLDALTVELDELLRGVRFLREISPRTADLLVSFGERMAAPIVAAALATEGVPSEEIDAREIMRTQGDGAGGGGDVDLEESRRLTRARLGALAAGTVPVVTGFIASNADGVTTTLGRGGSDYSATLLGDFLDAEEIVIWTDVDGVMTADPRVVPEARVLAAITYREAAEMAYFGSQVMHPRTMIPAARRSIPVVIRNTLRPEVPGTRITDRPSASALGVKTVSSVSHLALVTVEGNGMQGVPGIMKRVFSATAEARSSVYMVSQASSEHNISFVVREDEGRRVVAALEREFELELARGRIDQLDMRAPVGIVAVIGEGMKGTPGISQRMFTALGRGRINVLAIAQGSSELNLSAVVGQGDLRRAVGALHSRFGLTRDTHIFVLGKGLVGRALLRQVVAAGRRLVERDGIGLKVMGVCGRTEMVFDSAGLDDERLIALADGAAPSTVGGVPRPADDAIFDEIAGSRWLDVVIVDVTAEDHAAMHRTALERGFHVVTANKRPMSGPLAEHDAILAAAQAHGAGYAFETTFGAGLPALSTLQDLIATGDEIERVTGCFSGTLGYVCTEIETGRPLSEAVRRAAELGYTEPDPREDLSGRDVARKALIIARQLGARLELEDIEVTPVVPATITDGGTPAQFVARLPGADAAIAGQVDAAARDGRVLRHVAEIAADGVRVGLRAVPADSATGQLHGPDNILVFETKRYRTQPLVIRGPGAGAEVTAAGVLGDILKTVRTT